MKYFMRYGFVLIWLLAIAGLMLPNGATTQAQERGEAETVILVIDNFGEQPLISQLARQLEPGEVATIVRNNLDDGGFSFEQFAEVTSNVSSRVRPDVEALSSGNANVDNPGRPNNNDERENQGNSGNNSGRGSGSGNVEGANNCAVTLDSQIFEVRGAIFEVRGAGTDEQSDLSHGELVVQVIEAQLETLNMLDRVEIVPIDVTSLSTQQLAEVLAVALEEHGAGKNVIVNMSLAILPCGDIEALVAAESYLQALLSDEDADQIRNLLNVISMHLANVEGVLQDDALRRSSRAEEVAQNPRTPPPASVYFVAASGNYAANFSFLPAGWDNVLSVSASEEPQRTLQAGTGPAAYANLGQVMVPLLPDTPAGTSFAAPRVSALLAALLVDGAEGNCPNGNFDALVALDYENLLTLEAFDQVCPNIVPQLPQYGVQ